MNRIALIDIIRKEFLRQANKQGPEKLIVKPADGPDMLYVRGAVDVDAIAKAIRDE